MKNKIRYKRTFWTPFLILLFTLITTSCQQKKEESTKSKITVSILPQKYLVEQIAGNNFEIEVLIPPGASPVTYEPLPKQLANVKGSEIYFQIGHLVFEETWGDKIKSINPGLRVVNLSENLNLIEGDHAHGEVHDGHEEHVNPHIWMSPVLMKTMAKYVSEVLQDTHPENKQLFESNFNVFAKKIDSLDVELRDLFSGLENKNFLIYHPALTYFARDYGLSEFSLEKDGKEPSPKEFAELVVFARENKINKILVQSQFDKNNAITLAKEINAEIVTIDPLSEDWMQEVINLKNIFIGE